MTKHNLFYYSYASFTNTQLPLLKVAALWFDGLFILDPVGSADTQSVHTIMAARSDNHGDLPHKAPPNGA